MRRRVEDDRGPLILLRGDQQPYMMRGVCVPPFMRLAYGDEQPISLLTPESDRAADLITDGMLFSRDQVNEALRIARRRGLPLMTRRWYRERMHEARLAPKDPRYALQRLARDLERPMIGAVESAAAIACVQIHQALEPLHSARLKDRNGMIFSLEELRVEIDRLFCARMISVDDRARLHRYSHRLRRHLPQHTPGAAKDLVPRLEAVIREQRSVFESAFG